MNADDIRDLLGEVGGEHEMLKAHVEAFRLQVDEGAPTPADVKAFLTAVVEHFVDHFRREEEVMRRTFYPAITSHRASHYALWRQMLDSQLECEKCEWGPRCVTRVLATLAEWMERHVCEHDAPLLRYAMSMMIEADEDLSETTDGD